MYCAGPGESTPSSSPADIWLETAGEKSGEGLVLGPGFSAETFTSFWAAKTPSDNTEASGSGQIWGKPVPGQISIKGFPLPVRHATGWSPEVSPGLVQTEKDSTPGQNGLRHISPPVVPSRSPRYTMNGARCRREKASPAGGFPDRAYLRQRRVHFSV